jgi:hypothetical protein
MVATGHAAAVPAAFVLPGFRLHHARMIWFYSGAPFFDVCTLVLQEYGIIDHIIGGEEAVFKVAGSTRRFPKVSQ